MTYWAALALAMALGVQTSISPCPLVSNLAAITFLSRRLNSQAGVLLSGTLYTLGRMAAYMGVAAAVLYFFLAETDVSLVLGRYFNIALGPILILAGMFLLGLLQSTASISLGGARLQERAGRATLWWSLPLGVVFALSFCPISAALYFGGLVPLARQQASPLVLPAVYGVGTALPVVVFAAVAAFASQYVGRLFQCLTAIEKWSRVLTGAAFLAAGAYYCLVYIYDVPI